MFDYWDYLEKDIITPLIPAFRAKDCFLREGKIYIPMTEGIMSPWIHAKNRDDVNCNRYHLIYFRAYGFMPQKCYGCWKVVQRPRNISELFEIYQYQKEMRLASKCGIEDRAYVHGNYGAYWYNKSKEQGLERLSVVKKDFPNIPAILKRGCTEFERAFGPSDQWTKNPKAVDLENKLEKILVDVWRHDSSNVKELSDKGYAPFVNESIKKRWVEFAYDRGDALYKLYTRGRPIIPDVLTYDEEFKTGCQVDKIYKIARG